MNSLCVDFLQSTVLAFVCLFFFWLIVCFFCFVLPKDSVWTVMTARFRLPAGRTYNVRASELARDRQHTEVVCNILLLDNTVQAFRVNVSNLIIAMSLSWLSFAPLVLLEFDFQSSVKRGIEGEAMFRWACLYLYVLSHRGLSHSGILCGTNILISKFNIQRIVYFK